MFLPPATKLGQGNVFTGVCDSVNRGGLLLGGACSKWGGAWSGGVLLRGGGGGLLPGGSPPEGVPGPGGSAPGGGVPGGDTPQDGHCCGRYPSYWNALLFTCIITLFSFYDCACHFRIAIILN